MFWRADGSAWIPAIAGIFKIIGGGSHATLFLTITIIRKNASGSLRYVSILRLSSYVCNHSADSRLRSAALIYTTGAAVVLDQTIASTVTPFLARQSPTLPYILSIGCCVLASTVTIVYNTTEGLASDRACADDPSTQPLLAHVAASQYPCTERPWTFGNIYRRWKNEPSEIRKVIKSLGWILGLAACSKATRPLFITYIQHRDGITPELVRMN